MYHQSLVQSQQWKHRNDMWNLLKLIKAPELHQ